MTRKLNILIAIESFWDGGAEMFAIRLARELSLENNVFFIELYPYRTKIKNQKKHLNNSKILLFHIGKNLFGKILKKDENPKLNYVLRNLNFLYEKFCLLEIKFILWKYKIDIVNSHSWDTDLYFSNLKKTVKFHLISTFHGHYEFLNNLRHDFDMRTRLLLSKIDYVVFTTSSHLNTLENYNFPIKNAQKIFYGISCLVEKVPTKFEKGDVLKIIMVARGIKEKGWEEAILAVLKILEKYPKGVELNLVGEGVFLDKLKSTYKNRSIKFYGYKENVSDWIMQCHIGLLPTYYVAESLPNSIIEYLMCGKPVISTKIGAIQEMLDFNGLQAGYSISLIDRKVNLEDLYSAIHSYLVTPKLIEEHSIIAVNAAEKFTMSKCLDQYNRLFQNCMQIDN